MPRSFFAFVNDGVLSLQLIKLMMECSFEFSQKMSMMLILNVTRDVLQFPFNGTRCFVSFPSIREFSNRFCFAGSQSFYIMKWAKFLKLLPTKIHCFEIFNFPKPCMKANVAAAESVPENHRSPQQQQAWTSARNIGWFLMLHKTNTSPRLSIDYNPRTLPMNPNISFKVMEVNKMLFYSKPVCYPSDA